MPKIKIKGPVVTNDDQWIYDLFGIEATSPAKVEEAIEKSEGKDLEVDINSGGGSVFAGSEIYTMLKSYEGKVIVKIVGIAASAASVIAMAGNKTMMSPTAQMMIHNSSTYQEGDHNEMTKATEILKSTDNSIANAYRLKSGKTQKELLDLMNQETWLTAEKAKELNLIDEILFTDEIQLVASTKYSGLLPKEVINKMKNEKQNRKQIELLQTKLEYLKLKGSAIK